MASDRFGFVLEPYPFVPHPEPVDAGLVKEAFEALRPHPRTGDEAPVSYRAKHIRSLFDRIATLEADLAKERAENARLREALKKLANEVGCLDQFEYGMRAEIGNTNWSVLFARFDEANAALR